MHFSNLQFDFVHSHAGNARSYTVQASGGLNYDPTYNQGGGGGKRKHLSYVGAVRTSYFMSCLLANHGLWLLLFYNASAQLHRSLTTSRDGHVYTAEHQ